MGVIVSPEYRKSTKKERPKDNSSSSSKSPMSQKFSLIRDKIRQDPSLFTDRQRLKNMLSDCFAQTPLTANLLIMAYDENLGNCLKKYSELDDKVLQTFRARLVNHHGISEDKADWAVAAWYTIFNRKISANIKKEKPRETPQPRPPQYATPTTTTSIPGFGSSTPETSIIPTTTKHPKPPKTKSNGHTRSLDLLRRIYKQNFDSPTWAFWECQENDFYSVFSNPLNKPDYCWGHMPKDIELKKIALNVVCHGKYNETDIIHLRINQECTFGWALTYDSFCMGGCPLGDNIFKYSNITSGEDCIRKIDKNEFSTIKISGTFGIFDEAPTLAIRLINFLNAAKKIVAPGSLSNKSAKGNLTTSDFSQMKLLINQSSKDNQDGYYHDGSWWSMW